ncbi:MAG: hypothetical protein UZ17_ACD001002404 [Acidobacteria bacterium OLB17]|nr:MAG: hypothetical protein UZ17_ACD001002404 [Acidobacteria bacterium OLB17]MCZ2392117.1 hypothetical protein [Acidobacteriota bacterium]
MRTSGQGGGHESLHLDNAIRRAALGTTRKARDKEGPTGSCTYDANGPSCKVASLPDGLPSDLEQRLDASIPDPLRGSADQRRTLNLIADKAINLLKTNKKCRKALSSTSLDSLAVLEQLRPNDLYEDFGLINAGDIDNDYNAWTYYGPIEGVTRGAIEFYKDFFESADSAMGKGNVSDKLSTLEERQILVVLHEVGHADRKYVHPNEMNRVVKKGAKLAIDYQWDNATVNQFIYDNCFKK